MKSLAIATMLCLLLVTTSLASADQVILKNGDRITGTVAKMVGGTLEVETSYAGVVKLKWEDVARVVTDSSVKVKLKTGEGITGNLVESAPGTLVGKSPAIGETAQVPLDQVISINEPPKAPPTWTGYLELASTYRTGNVDSVSARTRASVVRETKEDRISGNASWNYEEQEDTLTARNMATSVKYDYFARPRTYLYAGTALESDEFKDLKLRTKIGIGLGRRFVVEPGAMLEGEAGLTYINDDFEEADDDDALALRLFGKYTRALLTNLNFLQSLEVLPALDDPSDIRLTSLTELSSKLSTHWSVAWSLLDEYDTDPSPGLKKNDLTNTISIRYTF